MADGKLTVTIISSANSVTLDTKYDYVELDESRHTVGFAASSKSTVEIFDYNLYVRNGKPVIPYVFVGPGMITNA